MEFAGPRRVVWTSCNISVCTPQKAKSKVNSDMDYSASKMGKWDFLLMALLFCPFCNGGNHCSC